MLIKHILTADTLFLKKNFNMWQDQEVRFDMSLSDIQPRHGEIIIDKLDMIEDTKGNAGDQGRLVISNLRIIWYSLTYPRINLGIGYNTVINMTTKNINMVQGNITAALYILTAYKNSRYEFIFTNFNHKNSRHYTSVMGVYRAYMSSKMYREVKLRGGFIQNKVLSTLPMEIVSSTSTGVWNLSTEQGNIGAFVVTNIRIVWFADMNSQFNVSLPYMAMEKIYVKPSKFGTTLVIVSKESNNGYVLGFRIDPLQKLQNLLKEITSLRAAFDKNPILGIDYTFECQSMTAPDVIDDSTQELQEDDDFSSDVLNLYFAENDTIQRKPIYNTSLGLATEQPKEGTSTMNVWTLMLVT